MLLNNETDSSLDTHHPVVELGALVPGDEAVIVGFEMDTERENFLQRLFEVGFLVGEHLLVLQEAPFSKNPMSVRIKEATYAIRREDAAMIQVRKI
jgi:ferrous iron transport protein A